MQSARAQLEALLIAMGDRDVEPGMPRDVDWMEDTAEEIANFIPGMEIEVHVVPSDTCDEEDLLRAAEEAGQMVQPANPDQALSSWQTSQALEEVSFMRAQERRVLLHQPAENYQNSLALEQATWAHRTRRQCEVEVEATIIKGGTEMGGPRMSRSWHLEVPSEGSLSVQLRFHMEDVVDQEDVETQLLPDAKKRRRDLAARAAQGNSALDYSQYADPYQRWRQGTLADKQVVNQYGEELLAYFQAQYAMADYAPPVSRVGC